MISTFLSKRLASSIAVCSAPNDCGLPSMPTRMVSPSGSSFFGQVLDHPDVARRSVRATRSQTEPISLSLTRPMPSAPITTRS